MYIAPNSTIKVYHGVHLEPTYENTLYFDNTAQQEAYFDKYLKYTFAKQYYTRVTKGVLRIQETAENLHDCNYLSFKNNSFGNVAKTFFAFITKVEYVNNVTSDVYFEIDIMQTWHFNYTLNQCFVEREHSSTDNIGDNLVPENIERGDFMLTNLNVPNCPFKAGDYKVVIARAHLLLGVAEEGEQTPEFQCVVSNVFNGISYTEYTASEAYQKIKEINDEGKADEIVAIFTVPSIFWGGVGTTNFTESGVVLTLSGLGQSFTSIGNYVPKNKKLFTGQFFGLCAYSSSGEKTTYNYEYFANPKSPTIGISFSMSGVPTAILIPFNYKGTNGENSTELLTCTDFPLGAYATDTFKAYLAQNSGALAHRVAMAGTSAYASTFTNSFMSTGTSLSAINTIGSLLGELRDKEAAPDATRGKAGNASSYARNKVGFQFYNYYIKEEFAKIIDDYFQMYGYACHKVKIPNRNVRTGWTYTKTVGCEIHGFLPADDAKTISRIYDNGIRFWKPNAVPGVYDTDNSPVATTEAVTNEQKE